MQKMKRKEVEHMMQLVGNYWLPDLNSLYVFQGITDNSSEVWKNRHT